MANLFIRTSIAPYRIDTYNALAERLGMRMCFYSREDSEQHYDPTWIESQCRFTPTYLKGWHFGPESRTVCRGLGKLVRQEKPDIVIVPEFQFALWQMRWLRRFSRKKFKIVSMCDDSIDMILQANDFSKGHRWLRGFVPKKLDDIITVTPEVCAWYREHFGKGQWLPIIMDEDRARETYRRLLPESARLEKEYGLQGKHVLLYVGRLVALKNVEAVIDAYSRLQRDDTILVIIGDGPERERLEAMAKTLRTSRGMTGSQAESIVFTGRLEGDALYAWYNLCDVLLLLSRREAFGAVTGEALMAGAKVLVSSKAGSACLVSEQNGAVADIDDPEKTARQLAELLSPVISSEAEKSSRCFDALRPGNMNVTLNERIDALVKAWEER